MFIATGEVQRRHTRNAYSCTQTIAIGLRDTSQYLGSLLCVIPTGVCGAEGPRLPTARTGTVPKKKNCSDGVLLHLYLSKERAPQGPSNTTFSARSSKARLANSMICLRGAP